MEGKKVTPQEINNVAWKACDTFRGVIDPSQYKDYILTFLFVRYLSALYDDKFNEYLEKYKNEKDASVRAERAMRYERFIVPKHCKYEYLYENRNESNIGELINIALEDLQEHNRAKLEGVFRNIDFNSETNLGQTKDRNRRLKSLIEDFAKLDLTPSHLESNDVIGDVYEYLIERFASDAGKKAGEFYTPATVATLLAELMGPQPGARIADPTCGSGSLLIKVAMKTGSRNFSIFGQEVNGSTYALARMNMFLHGLDDANIQWGDTINNPLLREGDTLMKFDIVVANPPFSLDKWGAENAGADRYGRFWRGIPPKSKGDYAFICHMVETTYENKGKVGVVAPHGVLFRGSSEGKIRKSFIEDNLLEAVIGLPSNLFFGTGIPTCILIFNRDRSQESGAKNQEPRAKSDVGTTDVLFIDASKELISAKTQNYLGKENIEKIVKAYKEFKTIDKFAYRATKKEIEENDYNLNIARYVDTFEEEAEVDIAKVQKEIEVLDGELKIVQGEMKKYINELGF